MMDKMKMVHSYIDNIFQMSENVTHTVSCKMKVEINCKAKMQIAITVWVMLVLTPHIQYIYNLY